MRTTRLLFPILMLTAACAGASARKDVLLPALRGEWPHVRELAVRGDAQIAPTAARMDGALAVGDRPTIAATWPPIETAALAGVQAELDAAEIGDHGATIARETVHQFGRGVALLGGVR